MLSFLFCCAFGSPAASLQEKDRRETGARPTSSCNNITNSQTVTSSSNSITSNDEAATATGIDVPPLETKLVEPEPAHVQHPQQPAPQQQQEAELKPAIDTTPADEMTECKVTTTPTTAPAQDHWLLKPQSPEDQGRKCLVLDLDETLVHSSFKMTVDADFVVPIEIDGQPHNVFVLKRPGVDTFMKRMGEIYEVVVFTASLSKYADPVLDIFDQHNVVRHRLFRESCFQYKGTYVKDLSQLGRELNQVIILDNSPASYIFHTANAVPVSSWFNDPHDSELLDLIPFFEDLAHVDDVTDILDNTIPGPFSHL